MTLEAGPTEHPSAEQIAAFLEEALSGEERNLVLQHLSECGICRKEVVEVRRLVKKSARFGGWKRISLAAAAILVLSLPLARTTFNPPETLRSSVDSRLELRATISVIAPAEGAVDSPNPMQFIWNSVGGGLRYELSLSDEAGDVVWTASTTDTVLTLGSEIHLEAGGRYFWYVDALTADGHDASSGVREFTIR